MQTNEKILAIVKEKGPILPAQIAKDIDENILMASARLSELASSKQIKISSIKIGGSPLYYCSGQESKLQNFTNSLHEKERKAYELLRHHKILRDSEQEPVIRVALRQIKDFAVPLQVNYENKAEIFWKWHLTDSKDGEILIRGVLSKKEEVKKEAVGKDAEEERKKNGMDDFLKKINGFFGRNEISIIEKNEIKKNSEIDFIIHLATAIGNVKYFCKTKNKRKISNADLSTALVHAQSKNLPLLFLSAGKLSKKAKEMLNSDFKNIIYKEI